MPCRAVATNVRDTPWEVLGLANLSVDGVRGESGRANADWVFVVESGFGKASWVVES